MMFVPFATKLYNKIKFLLYFEDSVFIRKARSQAKIVNLREEKSEIATNEQILIKNIKCDAHGTWIPNLRAK